MLGKVRGSPAGARDKVKTRRGKRPPPEPGRRRRRRESRVQRASECVCGARVTSKDCTAYTVVYSLWSRVSGCGREVERRPGRVVVAGPPSGLLQQRQADVRATRGRHAGFVVLFLYSSMQVTVHWRISRVLSWRPSLSGGLGWNKKKASASYKYVFRGAFSHGGYA